MEKAVFIDRDGTVIIDRGYLDNVEGIELLHGSGDGLKKMKELGYKIVLITNQSGIGRGMFKESIVEKQHSRLAELLEPFGVTFATIKVCPHHPDEGCECRKPEPGMLLDAAEELNIDLDQSWMIGDKVSDVMAGKAVGCRTILFGGGEELFEEADYYVEKLDDAARIISILGR